MSYSAEGRCHSFTGLAAVLVLVTAACGGDGTGTASASAAVASSSASDASATSSGSGGGMAAAGGAGGATTASGSGSGGGGAGSSGSGGSTNFDGCPTGVGVESCYSETSPGIATCGEFYGAGQGMTICGAASKSEPCPRNGDLYAICAGGISTYYYEDDAHQGFWNGAGAEASCTVQGATWCGP